MEDRNIIIDGLNINYKITEGNDPIFDFAGIKLFPGKVENRGTVLILHGWGGSSDSWVQVQKILAKNGYKTITPDLPGFGKSVPPAAVWGIQEYTDFVYKLIEKIKKDNPNEFIEPFFLLGHSFGGRVSIRFMKDHPQKIKGLILCDAAGIKPAKTLKTLIIFGLAMVGNAIFTPKHLQRFKDAARSFFYRITRNKDYSEAKGIMKEIIKKILAEDLAFELSEIKTKTLIVWGSKDKLVPVKYAHVFNKKIKNSEIEIMPGIGHSPHLETPETLADIILKFIDKNK